MRTLELYIWKIQSKGWFVTVPLAGIRVSPVVTFIFKVCAGVSQKKSNGLTILSHIKLQGYTNLSLWKRMFTYPSNVPVSNSGFIHGCCRKRTTTKSNADRLWLALAYIVTKTRKQDVFINNHLRIECHERDAAIKSALPNEQYIE